LPSFTGKPSFHPIYRKSPPGGLRAMICKEGEEGGKDVYFKIGRAHV